MPSAEDGIDEKNTAETDSRGSSDSGSPHARCVDAAEVLSPAEQHVLERVARSRTKGRWRRVRIVTFLAIMLIVEFRVAQYIFDFYHPQHSPVPRKE